MGSLAVEVRAVDLSSLPAMLRVEESAAVLRISRSRSYDEVAHR